MKVQRSLDDEEIRSSIAMMFDIAQALETNYRHFFDEKIIGLVEISFEDYQDAKAVMELILGKGDQWQLNS